MLSNVKQFDDYYEILGVNRDATDTEIKTAYIELSKKWHPDKNNNDAKEFVSNIFKKISIAYKVLSNPKLKTQYDKISKMSTLTYNDDIPHVIYSLDVTIHELYTGCSKNITFNRYSPCPLCNYNDSSCDDINVENNDKQNKNKCDKCIGVKYVKEEIDLTIDVPKGAYDKYSLKYKNIGNFIPHNDRKDNVDDRSDLIVVINETMSSFKRGIYLNNANEIIDMSNILIDTSIKFEDAFFGICMTLDYINDTKINVFTNDIIQNGDIFVLKNYGMPKIDNENENGDLFIRFCVLYPMNITKSQKRRIWQILHNSAYNETNIGDSLEMHKYDC